MKIVIFDIGNSERGVLQSNVADYGSVTVIPLGITYRAFNETEQTAIYEATKIVYCINIAEPIDSFEISFISAMIRANFRHFDRRKETYPYIVGINPDAYIPENSTAHFQMLKKMDCSLIPYVLNLQNPCKEDKTWILQLKLAEKPVALSESRLDGSGYKDSLTFFADADVGSIPDTSYSTIGAHSR